MSEKNINENADLDFIRSVLDDKKSNGENITIPTETLDESAYTNQPSEETVKTPRKRAPKKVEDDGEPVPFDLSSINVVEKNPVEKDPVEKDPVIKKWILRPISYILCNKVDTRILIQTFFNLYCLKYFILIAK